MALTKFPNGISSFGIPQAGAGQIPVTFVGTYFYVRSVNGGAGNAGTSPDAPLATIQQAIDKCTANNNDVIIVLSGHAEAVTSTSINMNKAGVTVVGTGTGLKRPTFTYGAAAATITVSAENCSWKSMHHIANFADVAAAFTLSTAKDFVLDGNTFKDNSTSLNFLSVVVTGSTANAADGLTTTGNYYLGLVATANAFVSVLGNLDRLNVSGNHVNKRATNDAGQFLTIAALVITGAMIKWNELIVLGATGNLVGIFLTGSSTTNNGIVAYNLVSSLDTTTELIATAGTKLQYFENYYTGNYDASAKLWPVVDAA